MEDFNEIATFMQNSKMSSELDCISESLKHLEVLTTENNQNIHKH